MRVATTVPDEWEPYIQKIVKSEGYVKVSRFVYDLIRKELVKRGFLGDDNV